MAKPSKQRKKRKVQKTMYCLYSQKALDAAIESVQRQSMSLRSAAKKFHVPRTTLCDKLKHLHPNSIGRPTVLSNSEETHLVDGILTAAKWGFPYTMFDIRNLVKCYLDKRGLTTPFKDNFPGYTWSRKFMKRHHARLTTRLSQNVKFSRAEVTPDAIQQFFGNLKPLLENVPPSNIINFDETNLCDDPGRQRVVKRAAKKADRVLDTSKSSTSVMMAGAADGTLWPPYVVYKSEQLWDQWTNDGPKYTRYNRTKSGWFDMSIFEDWFESLALPRIKKLNGIKIIIGDNVSSHLSTRVIDLCVDYQVHFVLLPPNSTHLRRTGLFD